MYNGGQKGEGGYAESRWTLNRWVLSLFRKMVSEYLLNTLPNTRANQWQGPEVDNTPL